MFDPLADVVVTGGTTTTIPTLSVEDPWDLATGDSTSPYQPAWALECGCGNTGFATGDLPTVSKVLAKAGWLVFHDRVLCPPCVRDDA